MPNRAEWDDIQVRYKEALKEFLASKEQPAAAADDGAKEIPVITISDDNDATMECSAENVDDKNSVKKSDDGEEVPTTVAVDDGGVEKDEGAADAAVVVNPDSSITDKALTDYQKQKFKL